MLFNGMLHLMLWEGWTEPRLHRRAHQRLRRAQGHACATARPTWWRRSAASRKEDLLQAARLFATSAATLSLYCQGLNQSSQRHRQERRADQPAPGHRRRSASPAPGPFSLTGQPNAMGGREVGGLANLLSAHRDLANPQHRAEVAALWGVPIGAREARQDRGRDVPGRRRRRDQGAVDRLHQPRAVDARPGHRAPRAGARRVRRRAGSLRHHRHLRLRRPAAAGHHLGREGRHRHQQRAPHQPRAAGRAGAGRGARTTGRSPSTSRAGSKRGCAPASATLFPYATTRRSDVWNEHRESTRGRDLDITGLSYALLEAGAAAVAAAAPARPRGRARLYEDGVFPTADGRARFADVAYKPVAEPREARYPFSLTTGRLRDQWHGMSRTGTLGRLFGHVAEPAVEMHPQDMARRQLQGRRPGARHLAARLDRAAGAGQHRGGPEPGLRRHALGRGVPERPLQHRRRRWPASTR